MRQFEWRIVQTSCVAAVSMCRNPSWNRNLNDWPVSCHELPCPSHVLRIAHTARYRHSLLQLQGLGIDSVGILVFGYLLKRDLDARSKQIARMTREEDLGSLQIELANKKTLRLAQLRQFARIVSGLLYFSHSGYLTSQQASAVLTMRQFPSAMAAACCSYQHNGTVATDITLSILQQHMSLTCLYIISNGITTYCKCSLSLIRSGSLHIVCACDQ